MTIAGDMEALLSSHGCPESGKAAEAVFDFFICADVIAYLDASGYNEWERLAFFDVIVHLRAKVLTKP